MAKLLLTKNNPSADYFLTMDHPWSGITEQEKREIQREALQKAHQIDNRFRAFLSDQQQVPTNEKTTQIF